MQPALYDIQQFHQLIVSPWQPLFACLHAQIIWLIAHNYALGESNGFSYRAIEDKACDEDLQYPQ